MDGPEAQEWGEFETEVMLRDVWKWIKGDEPGYTFQSAQYKDTWSRLDRMYVMHTEGFLPEILDISVSYGSIVSDHFPLIFEFTHHSIRGFHEFLGKPSLIFNSSFLDHEVFDAYMCQLIDAFAYRVQFDGYEAWEVFVANVQRLTRYYGIHHAFKRRKKLSLLVKLLDKCNSLLTYWPTDVELMGYQEVLISAMHDLTAKNYQHARLHRLRQEVEDANCQSHKFFHDLHESHARHNVVRLEENGIMCSDPREIVKKCIEYYTQLLDVQVCIDDNVKNDRDVFFNGVKNHVSHDVAQSLDANISEDEVEHVMSHLANDKSPGWDGLTHELFKKYVIKLKGPFTTLFQKVWTSGEMPHSWKIGLIKLLPKVPSPSSFAQWRPISLMGGMYKIFAKVMANRLHKVLPSIIHNSQYGFLAKRDILHNIFNVQMAIDYAKESKQELVLLQLDIEKAYDNVDWSFIHQLMSHMGFGDRMSKLIYTLGEGSVSHVMFNGGVTQPISIRRSVRQGCPVSPLLFTIVTHPILVKLHNMAMEEELLGLRLPSGKPCIVQALADDHIMFLAPIRENICKTIDVWELFSNASGLRINMHKFVLISCTEQDVLGLGWSGRIVHRGMICRHLGYPIGVDVSHVKLIEWVSKRLEDKFMYWRSQFWPFHVRLKVVQSIMVSMVSYYLPLLPWSKKALEMLSQSMRMLLWKRKGKSALSWLAWDHVCTPKRLGGASILNLYEHMVARRFTFIRFMFEGVQPWTEMVAYFIEKNGIKLGNMKVEANWWNVINSDRDVKCAGSMIVNHLLTSWQSMLDFVEWHPPQERGCANSLQMEVLATSRLLRWEGKQILNLQFNRMARLGLVTVKDAMLVSQRRLMAFRTIRSTFRIPKGYTFIWDKLQEILSAYEPIPDLDGRSQELDWRFVGNKRLTMISTNVAYHKLIDKHKWLEEKVIKIWGFHKPITWWLHVIKAGWCSRLMLRGKVFIWRVMVGALPLGDALKKRNITKGSCFFCLVELEHSRHRFISCPMARMVWRCINLVWMSLIGVSLSSFSWAFAH